MSPLALHRIVTGIVAFMGLGLAVRELVLWNRTRDPETLIFAGLVAAFAILLVLYLRKLNRYLHRHEPDGTSLPREIGDVGEGEGEGDGTDSAGSP